MTTLYPSTVVQVVMSAYNDAYDGYYYDGEWIPNTQQQLAAAIHKFIELTLPEEEPKPFQLDPRQLHSEGMRCQRAETRRQQLAIVTELAQMNI